MATAAPARLDRIALDGVGKRFGRQWIVEGLRRELRAGTTYGIRGRNGSGKSTLLRLLAGQLTPTIGAVRFRAGNRELPVGDIYNQVSWTGPYFEIVEELTIREALEFHFSLKPLLPGYTIVPLGEGAGARVQRHGPKEGGAPPSVLLDLIELAHVRNRKLTDCSSGMRQRVLLATALYTDTPLLLLDEPTVTLDVPSAEWFSRELRRVRPGRLVVIASNDERDLRTCEEFLVLK